MKKHIPLRFLSCFLSILLLGGCGVEAETTQNTGGLTAAFFGSNVADTAEIEATEGSAVERPSGSLSMPYNGSYGWDPYGCLSMENQAVMELIYEPLFTLDETFTPQGVLADSYTVSEDGLAWTITLRTATFSTGAVLTAQDVVSSMTLAAAGARYSSRFTDIASYSATGSSTVTVTLNQPNGRLPTLLTFPIIPFGAASDSPPGTGPFVREGELLTQNPYWTGTGDALHITSVTLVSSASAEDTRDLFEEQQVNFVYNNPCAGTAATYHGNYEVWNSPTTRMQYLGFNFSKGLFADSTARAAITHAIDRESIASGIYHHFAEAAVLPVPPGTVLYTKELADSYAYTSAADATEKLEKSDRFATPSPVSRSESSAAEDTAEKETETTATSAEGVNEITFLIQNGNTQRNAAAESIVSNLTDAGFTVTIQSLAKDEYTEALEEGEFDIYLGEVLLKPDFDLRSMLTEDGALAYGGVSESETVEDLISAAMVNDGNYYDLYQYIMEQGLLCPVCFLNDAVYTSRGTVAGLQPTAGDLFANIEEITINNE